MIGLVAFIAGQVRNDELVFIILFCVGIAILWWNERSHKP
jgi:hypothetical protein